MKGALVMKWNHQESFSPGSIAQWESMCLAHAVLGVYSQSKIKESPEFGMSPRAVSYKLFNLTSLNPGHCVCKVEIAGL